LGRICYFLLSTFPRRVTSGGIKVNATSFANMYKMTKCIKHKGTVQWLHQFLDASMPDCNSIELTDSTAVTTPATTITSDHNAAANACCTTVVEEGDSLEVSCGSQFETTL
jgi:hypothetical protein